MGPHMYTARKYAKMDTSNPKPSTRRRFRVGLGQGTVWVAGLWGTAIARKFGWYPGPERQQRRNRVYRVQGQGL